MSDVLHLMQRKNISCEELVVVKIVKIKGGLGNQLFQYSFAMLLQTMTNENVKIDMSSYNNYIDDGIRRPRLLKCNISLDIADIEEIQKKRKFQIKNSPLKTGDKIKIMLERALNREYYFETDRGYRNPKKLLKYSYFDGYWQSWRYLEPIEKLIRKELLPNYQLHINTLNLQETMQKENSVFIGIRRGDYLLDQKHYGSFGEQYYNDAIEILLKAIDNPVFYIFSNDIKWVKQNLDFRGEKVIYREKEAIVDDFEELQLMSSCHHAIIGNSTFHWWGAWLINSPDKIIIAPKKWFFDNKSIDIIPPTWIRIGEKDINYDY